MRSTAKRLVLFCARVCPHRGRPPLRARSDPRSRSCCRPAWSRSTRRSSRPRCPSIVREHRRLHPVPLAVLGLPAGPGGVGAGLRQARRHCSAASRCCCSASGCSCSGSILCGVAWSMPALIAFRAVQGLGAGAVQPMAITIAGDIYTVAERAQGPGLRRQRLGRSRRWSARRSAACSPSTPVALDLLRQHPAVPARRRLIAARNFHETVDAASTAIDYLGAALLTAG